MSAIVPSPSQPGLSPAERLALTVRRDATMRGACACGARAEPAQVRGGGVAVMPLLHMDDCPAVSPLLERLAGRLGDRGVYELVVAEIEVAA
jgi:hypothetical protein